MIPAKEKLDFNGFTKVNESVSPDHLQNNELVTLENMRLDEEIGVPTIRKGFSHFHNQVDTSGTINNIYDVKDIDDNNYLLAAIGTKLRKSTDGTGTWSDIKTGLTESKLRMVQFGTKFYFINDNEKPFYTDLTDVYDFEIERPDISNMTLEDTGPSITKFGIYTYLLVFVSNDGMRSNPSFKAGIRVYYETNITLSNIPVSSDSRIISKMLFRTKVSSLDSTGPVINNTFYLVTILDNSITSYVDTVPDDSLDLTESIEYTNMPQKVRYINVNSDRIFLANLSKELINRVIPPPYTFLFTVGGAEDWISDDTQIGNLSVGLYKYAYSFVDSNGNESDLIFLFSHTMGANKKLIYNYGYSASFTIGDGDPTTGYNFLDDNKYVRFYRTKADGSTYYYLKDYTSDYVSFTDTDNIADGSLGTEYGIYNTNLNSEISQLSTSILFSNLNAPLEFPELNLIDIYPDDSGEITGIFDDDNGITVFKQNSICKLYTNGDPSNWYVKKIAENIGCDEPDSICKYDSSYFFVYQKRPYLFSGSVIPIGEEYKNSFDLVDSFLGCTYWNKGNWFILSVKVDTAYWLFCYDTKLKTWYKFSINKADCIVNGKYGAKKDVILIGGNTYIVNYDETADYDSDSGSNINIYVSLKTKNYIFDFVRARLMYLFLNYKRLLDTDSEQIFFRLTDPESGNSRTLTDEDETTTNNTYYIPTDGMYGTLKRCTKINLLIYGNAISKFYSGRLDYNPELYGTRRKVNVDLEGIGMQVGLKFGVNE